MTTAIEDLQKLLIRSKKSCDDNILELKNKFTNDYDTLHFLEYRSLELMSLILKRDGLEQVLTPLNDNLNDDENHICPVQLVEELLEEFRSAVLNRAKHINNKSTSVMSNMRRELELEAAAEITETLTFFMKRVERNGN